MRSKVRKNRKNKNQKPPHDFSDTPNGVEKCGGADDLLLVDPVSLTGSVLESLDIVTAQRIYALGGQVAVYIDGNPVVNVASGLTGSGMPMTSQHLHHIACLFKPFPILVLASVVEQAGHSADDPLEKIVELPDWCPSDITVRSLGSYEDGLNYPSGMQWIMAAPHERHEMLVKVRRGREPAYSEITGSLIASHAIKRLTGEEAVDYCVETLLHPLGLHNDVLFTDGRQQLEPGRVQCLVTGLPRKPIPMLTMSLMAPSMHDHAAFVFGGLATMNGVAGLYAAIGKVMSGTTINGLPSPDMLRDLTAPEYLEYELTSKRYTIWAGGLMHNLSRVNISQIAGKGSVGHLGGASTEVAVFDPTRRAAVALFLNGANTNFDDMELTRLVSVDRIFRKIPTLPNREQE